MTSRCKDSLKWPVCSNQEVGCWSSISGVLCMVAPGTGTSRICLHACRKQGSHSLKRGRQRFGDLALRWGEPAEQEGNSDQAHTRDPAGASRHGHQVKMDRLRTLFGELGFEQVRSYIQTGNVFFGSKEQDRRALRTKIEEHLQTSLGYAVATCLRTREELEALVSLDPFHGIQVTPDMRL